MRLRRRLARGAVFVVVAATLTGCVSIPGEGPVEPGRTLVDAQRPPRVQFQAFGPAQGDSPIGIVRGFLRAAADFSLDHNVARSFLTADKRTTWRPVSEVIVYRGSAGTVNVAQTAAWAGANAAPTLSPPSTASPPPTSPAATLGPSASAVAATPSAVRIVPTPQPVPGAQVTVTVTTPVVARILDGGAYQASDPGDIAVTTFHLTVVEGQWRIRDPADGVLISLSDFSATFGDVPLYYPELTGRWLVPDVRWFPLTSSPTVVVDALLEGPSAWLEDAVTSGALSGTELTANGVRNSGGSTVIDLKRRALEASPTQRQVLLVQLRATLAESARVLSFAVGEVTVTVEQARYEIPQNTAAMPRPAEELGLDARPVVLDAQNRLARLDGLRSTPVLGLPALSPDATHPAVNADGTVFAVLTAGDSTMVTLSSQQAPRGQIKAGTLTAPSFDSSGWVWTSPTQSAGTVYAVRGTQRIPLPARWLAGYQVRSVRISREGARALVVAGRSGRSYAFVTGVVRDETGRPTGFTDPPLRLVSDLSGARDGAWLDARRIAVLGTRAEAAEQRVWLVQIGGEVAAGVAAPDALTIAVGSNQYELWVQTADGAAYQAGADFPRLPGVRWPAVPG